MQINRNQIMELYSLIKKNYNKHFDINTQYKLMKIKKILDEEVNIYNQQLASLSEYCEKDNNGNFIQDSAGGLKVKASNLKECSELIEKINQLSITLPDIYFSLDELEPLELTLSELELLEPFIK